MNIRPEPHSGTGFLMKVLYFCYMLPVSSAVPRSRLFEHSRVVRYIRLLLFGDDVIGSRAAWQSNFVQRQVADIYSNRKTYPEIAHKVKLYSTGEDLQVGSCEIFRKLTFEKNLTQIYLRLPQLVTSLGFIIIVVVRTCN
jgi:hypothetical protein